MKIQAILTVNENGNYNIVGWSSEQTEYKHLLSMKSLSAEGLDCDNFEEQVQYLVEFEVATPDYQLKKVPENEISVIKIAKD